MESAGSVKDIANRMRFCVAMNLVENGVELFWNHANDAALVNELDDSESMLWFWVLHSVPGGSLLAEKAEEVMGDLYLFDDRFLELERALHGAWMVMKKRQEANEAL